MKILDKTTQTYKELVLKPGGDTLPIGGIIAFDSDTIPSGWLLCDGRAVSRTEYAELFKVIGTKHGSGNGSTTFNLPNPKGRTLVGKDSSDTDFSELGKTGEGTAKDKIKVAGTYYGLVDTKIVSSTEYGGQGLVSVTKNTSESAQSLDNNGIDFMPPHLVTNFIIKAKNTAVVKGDVIQENDTASENNTYSAKAIDNKLKANIITGQEFETGRIIDGKKEFGKKFTYENISGVKNYDFDTTNISEFTHMEGFCTTSTGGKYPLFSFNPYATGTGLEPISSTLFCAWIEGSNLVVLAKKITLTKATIYIYYTKNT